MTAPRRKPTDRRAPARATRLRATGKDGPQRVAVPTGRWTDKAEAKFLDHLAASCNVTYAAAQVRFSKEAIYARRRRDAAFALKWQDALAQGVARINMALVEEVEKALAGVTPNPDTPMPKMTVVDMINVIKLHLPAVTGEGRSPGWRRRPRGLAAVRDSILAKLEAIEAMRRAGKLP